MPEKPVNAELAAIEAALSSLTPAASAIQRDRLLFLAGQAAARRTLPAPHRRFTAWLWPCATAVSLLVAATFGTLWAAGGKPKTVERIVYVQAERAPAMAEKPIVKSASGAFADWQAGHGVRMRSNAEPRRPNATPVRRDPGNSENGNRSHAVHSIS
jgi:hypothetical protein